MKNTHIINQLNRIYRLVQAIDIDWHYAARAQKKAALAAIVKLRDAAQKEEEPDANNL